jgi:hypothetical protein
VDFGELNSYFATSTRVGVLVRREKSFWDLFAQGSLTAPEGRSNRP